MGKKKVGKVVLGAKIIHVVKVRPIGMTTWYRPSCYDLHTWHDAMEAVSYWIKSNDLKKIVTGIKITTTIKFSDTPRTADMYHARPLYPSHYFPVGVAPIESESAPSQSESAHGPVEGFFLHLRIANVFIAGKSKTAHV